MIFKMIKRSYTLIMQLMRLILNLIMHGLGGGKITPRNLYIIFVKQRF